jgi:transcriptional regulator of acetoin/glycerol metabolism
MPYLDPPVWWWTGDTSLPSPEDVKTLVIRNVDAQNAGQQRALLSWLESTTVASPRVVSTTTGSLFQRVADGLFLEALYYRLNTVMLDVTHGPITGDPDSSGSPGGIARS